MNFKTDYKEIDIKRYEGLIVDFGFDLDDINYIVIYNELKINKIKY